MLVDFGENATTRTEIQLSTGQAFEDSVIHCWLVFILPV